MRWITTALLLGAVGLLSGCGSGRNTRTVTIKGSDTMVILGQRWAEIYMHHNPGVTVQVTGGGSGTGIAALTNGGTDICAASRPMKDKERADIRARQNNDVVETAVALDGVAVFLNTANPIQQFDLEQLRKIYRGEITDWKDVGGTPGRIICYGRENNSGTHMYFKEHVLNNQNFATEVQPLPGTAAVINAVVKDKNGIGYGGIGYDKGVKAVPLSAKAGDKAIEPTMDNVVSGAYPLSRKLFFYTAGEPAGEIKAFIDWTLSDEGQRVCQEVGYYPIPRNK
jgi:phosphate transport system substrate-binding protein